MASDQQGMAVAGGGGSADLSILQGQVSDIAIYRAPEVVLAEARNAAVALQDVIKNKTKPVIMNGEQYLEYEDWQTVGRFYHVTAKVEKTEYVQYGAVRGFSASAVALRSDGQVISRAEADCLNDEPKWSSKPKYEWRDKEGGGDRERVQVGEEPVPLFQLKSMAQTRACAKALRNVLAWVVVLAGYRATPAEELEQQQGSGSSGHGGQQQQQRSSGSSGSAAPASGTSAPASGLPEGATKVKDVKTKTGTNARGEWTRWDVFFEDGRRGGTFSKTDGEHAERAMKSGAYVIPNLAKTDKGHDLKGFEKWPEKPKAEDKPHPEEPINGPELVLTVRKINTDAGPRFVIQTDKRELVSDQQFHADMAVEARKQKVGLTPKVEIVDSGTGKKINRLLELLPERSLDGAEAGGSAAPAAESKPEPEQQQQESGGQQQESGGKTTEKPKRTRKTKEREPGEEG